MSETAKDHGKDHCKDHGGDIDRARAEFGGAPEDWIDLSTGINPRPYPLPSISAAAWAALPTKSDMASLANAARAAYRTDAPIVAVAGAQAAIQLAPRLRPAGDARILAPTYNEHAASFRAAGWRVAEATGPDALAGADIAVIVNPNNPDGRRFGPEEMRALSRKVGLLIVDESFADPHPDLSAAHLVDEAESRLLILRSFGKFYGLAGLRLGFVIGGAGDIDALKTACGPWPVSGPAIEIARLALSDDRWREETTLRLARDAARLDRAATGAGWRVIGGTTLFRLYETPDAATARTRLARAHIWSRIFPYSKTWLRLGLPDGDADWARIEAAFA